MSVASVDMRWVVKCALLALVCLPSALAAAKPDRVLVGRDLSRRAIELASIGQDGIGVAERDGIARLAVDNTVAILPLGGEVVWRAEPVPLANELLSGGGSWVLELTDGQRIRGRPGASDDPEFVAWVEIPGLADVRLDVPMERVRMIARDGIARPSPTSVDDRVTTGNGDVLMGFVDSVGQAVRIESGNGINELALDLIARVDLANPPSVALQPLVWLVDGSVLAADRFLETSAGRLAFELSVSGSTPPRPMAGPRIDVPLGQVAAIELQPGRLVPLASLGDLRSVATSERRWTPAARVGDAELAVLGLADVVLPGPMEVRAAVPAGIDRFWTEARLANESPWSDATLVVEFERAGSRVEELQRLRLTETSPTGTVGVGLDSPAGGGTLVLRLEAGQRGAIRDRVILRQPTISLTPALP